MSFTTPSWSSALLRSLAPHSAMGWLHLRSGSWEPEILGHKMLRASEWKVTKRASGWDDAKIGKTGLSPKESRAWERGFVSGACRCAQACLSRGWGCASRGQRLHSSSPLHSKPWDRHKGRNRLGEMFLCPVKRKPATFNLRTDKGQCCLEQKNAPSSDCGGHRMSQSLRNSLRSTG